MKTLLPDCLKLDRAEVAPGPLPCPAPALSPSVGKRAGTNGNLRSLTRLGLLLLAAALLAPVTTPAQVFWRVSIKVFTDSNGNRPSGRTDAEIQADYDTYNNMITTYARGCRMVVTEIVILPASLSSWYNVQARNSANRDALLTAATGDPATYAYRSTAINIYINNSSSGVCCGANNGLIFVGNEDGSTTMFHEIGHMLGLCHKLRTAVEDGARGVHALLDVGGKRGEFQDCAHFLGGRFQRVAQHFERDRVEVLAAANHRATSTIRLPLVSARATSPG